MVNLTRPFIISISLCIERITAEFSFQTLGVFNIPITFIGWWTAEQSLIVHEAPADSDYLVWQPARAVEEPGYHIFVPYIRGEFETRS